MLLSVIDQKGLTDTATCGVLDEASQLVRTKHPRVQQTSDGLQCLDAWITKVGGCNKRRAKSIPHVLPFKESPWLKLIGS